MISSGSMPRPGRRGIRAGVPAGLDGGQPDVVQSAPQLGDVLDLDPVELEILAIGDVQGTAGELVGGGADDAHLARGQRLAVHADALHEEVVLQLGDVELGGAPAVDALPALGVQAPPPEAAVQVGGVDGLEAARGVVGEDPPAGAQRVAVLFEGLVVVERLAAVDEPLAVGAAPARRADVARGAGASGRVLPRGAGGDGGGARCRLRRWDEMSVR